MKPLPHGRGSPHMSDRVVDCTIPTIPSDNEQSCVVGEYSFGRCQCRRRSCCLRSRTQIFCFFGESAREIVPRLRHSAWSALTLPQQNVGCTTEPQTTIYRAVAARRLHFNL